MLQHSYARSRRGTRSLELLDTGVQTMSRVCSPDRGEEVQMMGSTCDLAYEHHYIWRLYDSPAPHWRTIAVSGPVAGRRS
jgi:hypothetical protein